MALPFLLGLAAVAGSAAIADAQRAGRSLMLYHGTSPEAARRILRHGFDPEAARSHDPGDFGWGTYLTSIPARARGFGVGALLRVEVDPSKLAFIPSPYFLEQGRPVSPRTPVERLLYDTAFESETGRMRTVQGRIGERISVARAVRDAFLVAGWHGIRSGHSDDETVIFDNEAIRRVTSVRGRGTR